MATEADAEEVDVEDKGVEEFYVLGQGVCRGGLKIMTSIENEPESLKRQIGAEAPYSFKEESAGPPYCKLTTRHHIFRYYVSPNQTCKVLGDFGQQS